MNSDRPVAGPQDILLRVKPEQERALAAHPKYRDLTDEEVIDLAYNIPGMYSRRGKREPLFIINTRAFAVALLMRTGTLLGPTV